MPAPTATAPCSASTNLTVEDGLGGPQPSKEPKDEKPSETDPNLIGWDRPDDPENPKNWSIRKKWGATVCVSMFTFISPVASSMVAPALIKVEKDLNITTQIERNMVMSIFVLGYAIGPLLFGPMSEIFGRVRVIQSSNLIFIAWNLGCGFAQNKVELFVFQFLSGIGGAAPLSVGGGVLSDCWTPAQRGQAVGIYSLMPLLGPIVGLIAGGWIAEQTTWRWVFWSTTIAASFIQVLGLLGLPETHAATILKRKCHRLSKDTGNLDLHTGTEPPKSIFATLRSAMVRPAQMLATQSIVQIIAVYMAYLFGIIYLLAAVFPVVWSQVYRESIGIGGLNYISLGTGFVIGAQVNTRLMDWIYRLLANKSGTDGSSTGQPEYRIPTMFIGSCLIPIGILWFGWSVQGHVHWIMPNIGTAIFSAGAIICMQCMQAYTIDSYSRFAASGLAAVVVLRSLAGFGFPLFAPYLYRRLNYGWGSSVLALASIVIGIPAPFIFYFMGRRLRAASRYAAG